MKASPENNYYYNKSLQGLAKNNKKNLTKSAACMWKYILSGKQMMGFKFRRERPILNYIVDFVCLELLLIIEVDGFSHDNPEQNIMDQTRDEELLKIGFTTLRFSSWEVLNRVADVSITISDWIKEKQKD